MNQAIIFDFDGTLIDSVHAHIKVLQEFATKKGHNISDDDIYSMNGMNKRDIVRYLRNKGIKLNFLEILIKKRKIKKKIQENITVFPSTIPCLKKLSGIPMAIATSADRKYLKKNLTLFSLQDYFSTTITSSEVKIGKPKPDIFLEAARKLNTAKENCLVVEDSICGVLAAKRAGCKVVAVLTTTPKERFISDARPDAFVDSLGQLTPQLFREVMSS